MKKRTTRQTIWLRTVRKYRKLAAAYRATPPDHKTFRGTSLRRKLNILRRRLLHMNRAWKLGIATASLMAWLSAPAVAQFPASIELFSLDGTTGFVLNGIDADDRSGRSVSSAGDVNNDGFDDVMVGARYADPNGSQSGEAYVIFGQSSFASILEFSALNGSNGFTLNGINALDGLGRSVSSAGDVNNDGFDDLMVGANGADPSGNGSGETYVIFGQSSFAATLELSALNGSNGFTLNGIAAGDVSGRSVSSAGDVNNDGFGDLIIGAFGADPNGFSSGETYVIFGQSNFAATLELSALDGSNGFTLNGIDANDYSGISVSSAGDVNNDGFDDLIIGAYGADPNGNGSGETYVIFGQSSFAASLDLSALNGTNGFTLNGIDADDNSGVSVSSAGDVNDDGFDDLMVGARNADPNGSYSGETYVVFGQSSFAATLELSDLDGSNGFTLNGIDAYDYSGRPVSSAGDVNNDGFDDLMVGANGADPNGNNYSGETYVIFGQSSFAATLALSALDGSNGFTLNGIDAYDYSGRPVSSAGDVNNDGFDDLMVGANGADPNGNNYSGETYVIFGQSSFAATLALSALDGSNGFTLNGIDAYDYSGRPVSSAGDVNNDGFDDLMVGASSADPNGTSSGESYVVFGCDRIASVSVQVSPVSVEEDAGMNTLSYTFTASASPCFDLSIPFSASGTATFNDDYYLVRGSDDFNGTTGTVTIPAGQTSVDLVFQVQQDAIFEPDETIIVTVTAP